MNYFKATQTVIIALLRFSMSWSWLKFLDASDEQGEVGENIVAISVTSTKICLNKHCQH
jgi:hypothetical protein